MCNIINKFHSPHAGQYGFNFEYPTKHFLIHVKQKDSKQNKHFCCENYI
jgi:hypothetical protein